ncbi:MAG: hypothetical protein HKP61_19895 [Dactylosporangium sp.]|nr:hypothetical protein [Dactylosporangium sp.]NNJ63148.1 hypothetical protein [Dactylosporangium sp.]
MASSQFAVIVALLAVLLLVLRRLSAYAPATTTESIVLDGTFGLYLGWVTVATSANIAAVVAGSGVRPSPGLAETAAAAALLIVGATGVLLARAFGGRTTIAAAMAWGIGWIAIGRVTDDPRSPVTAAVAVLAAVVVVLAATRTARSRARLV